MSLIKDRRLEGGYENVPTDDIHMTQVDFQEHWLFILRDLVQPIQQKVFTGYFSDVSIDYVLFLNCSTCSSHPKRFSISLFVTCLNVKNHYVLIMMLRHIRSILL